MSRDEAPLSTHAASQAWFAMLLTNDPNTALVGALRPSRQHALWAALRRPFERSGSELRLLAGEAAEQMPGLRPRRMHWIGAALLLALGSGLAVVGLDRFPLAPAGVVTAAATIPGERLAVAALPVRPAPPAPALPIAASIATDLAPPAPESLAPARAGASAAQQAPRAAVPAVSSPKNTKKKAAARRFRRGLTRALPAESRR